MFKALSYIQSVPYECGDFKHRLCSSAFPIWWLCKLGQVPVCLSFLFLKMRRRIVANIDGCCENWIFIYLEYLMKCVILFEIFKVMKSKIKEVLKVKMYSILHVFGGKEGQMSSFLTLKFFGLSMTTLICILPQSPCACIHVCWKKKACTSVYLFSQLNYVLLKGEIYFKHVFRSFLSAQSRARLTKDCKKVLPKK